MVRPDAENCLLMALHLFLVVGPYGLGTCFVALWFGAGFGKSWSQRSWGLN